MTDHKSEQRRLQHFVCSQDISIKLFVAPVVFIFFLIWATCAEQSLIKWNGAVEPPKRNKNLFSIEICQAASQWTCPNSAKHKTDEREFNW